MAKRALLVGLGLLALLCAAAPFVELQVPGLTRAVLDRSHEETGIAIEASRSRFRLLEGLTLEGVSARARTGVVGYDVRLDRIQFQHRPLSLLAGRFEIRRVALERPRIGLSGAVSHGDGETSSPSSRTGDGRGAPDEAESDAVREGAPGAGGLRGIRIAPSVPIEVSIRGASFHAGDRLHVEGLDLTLSDARYDRRALTPLHALESSGAASIARIAFERLRIENVEAGFHAQGGRFVLEPLRLQTPSGSFTGKLSLDFNVLPFRYRLELAGDAVQIAFFGAGRLRMDAEGFGSESRNLTGAGAFELGPGTLPDAPVVRAIETTLAGADFRAAAARFEVHRNRIHVDGLRFEAESFVLAVYGSIDLDGPLDLTVTLNRGDRESVYSLKGTTEAPAVTRRD